MLIDFLNHRRYISFVKGKGVLGRDLELLVLRQHSLVVVDADPHLLKLLVHPINPVNHAVFLIVLHCDLFWLRLLLFGDRREVGPGPPVYLEALDELLRVHVLFFQCAFDHLFHGF